MSQPTPLQRMETAIGEAEIEAAAIALVNAVRARHDVPLLRSMEHITDEHAVNYRNDARAALTAAAQVRAQAKRENCKHQRRQGSGTVSSSGVSHGFWHCPDCLASGEYHSPWGTMAIVGPIPVMPICGATEDKEG